MAKPLYLPIYDIDRTYEDNLKHGPNKKFKASLKIPEPTGNYEILGHKVNSPFGAAACPTGTDSRFIKLMFDNGYDIVTTKSRRSVYYRPNQAPNVVHIVPGRLLENQDFEVIHSRKTASMSEYHTLTIANSFGNHSIDPEYWVPDAYKANLIAVKLDGRLLITSVLGTIHPGFNDEDYYRDFAKTALMAKESGAQALEVNLCAPLVNDQGVVCYSPEATERICRLVREAVGYMPITIKIGYFPKSHQNLLESVIESVEPYIDAISAINVFAAPVLDSNGHQAMPGKGRLMAGLSGHAIKDISLDMTKRLSQIRKKNKLDFQIIGIGGILTPDDFHDYLKAGADAAMSATGAMWNPNLAAEIKATL